MFVVSEKICGHAFYVATQAVAVIHHNMPNNTFIRKVIIPLWHSSGKLGHPFSLELATGRIWDYVHDTFVHIGKFLNYQSECQIIRPAK